jgi:hypothetical protein
MSGAHGSARRRTFIALRRLTNGIPFSRRIVRSANVVGGGARAWSFLAAGGCGGVRQRCMHAPMMRRHGILAVDSMLMFVMGGWEREREQGDAERTRRAHRMPDDDEDPRSPSTSPKTGVKKWIPTL